MKLKFIHILYVLFVFVQFVLLYLNVNNYLTFGYGLGDIVEFSFFSIILIAFITTYCVLIYKNTPMSIFIILLFGIIITTLLHILLISIFRGEVYPWNGKLFFRSPF